MGDMGNTDQMKERGMGIILVMSLATIIFVATRSLKSYLEHLTRIEAVGEKPDVILITPIKAVYFHIAATCILPVLRSEQSSGNITSIPIRTPMSTSFYTGYFFLAGFLYWRMDVMSIMIPIRDNERFMEKFMRNFLAFEFYVIFWMLSLPFAQNWFFSNLLAVGYVLYLVFYYPLKNITAGVTLLTGSFIYDLVFASTTNVLATTAKPMGNFLKMALPAHFLQKKMVADHSLYFVGLEQIALPAAFMALLLKFDNQRNSRIYFDTSVVGYIAGFVASVLQSSTYEYHRSALLYLIPGCVLPPLFLALIRGDIRTIFRFQIYPNFVLN